MAISDQYETEPSLLYSGSMSDGVNVKAVLSDNSTTLGVRFASRVDGLAPGSNTINLLYNERLNYVSGTFIGSKTKLRTFESLTEGEFYYDSFVPSPASISNVDGKISPYLSFSLDGQENESKLAPASEFDRPGQSEKVAHVFFAGERRGLRFGNYPGPSDPLQVEQFINFDWSSSPYPFQTKYKHLLRTLKPNSRYSETISVTQDPTTTLISDPFDTSNIGSFFITLSANAGTARALGRWTQIWGAPGSALITGNSTFEHVFVKGYNDLNDVVWANIPETSLVPNNQYVAVGAYGTIITSFDGKEWNIIASGYDASNINPKKPLVVSGYPSSDSSNIVLRSIVDTGISGIFNRYIIVGEFGIIYSTTIGKKEPTRTNWTYFDLPTAIGASTVSLWSIASNNDEGSAILGGSNVCAVGKQFAGTTKGLIVSSDQNGTSWTAATGTAILDDVEWYDIVYLGAPANNFVAVGKNGLVSPTGIVGRSPTSSGTGTWIDISPSGASKLFAVSWNQYTNALIAVGENGEIWRTTNPEVTTPTWTKLTPANGYTGQWTSIKYVYNINGITNTWVVTGENGETQYSDDDGITWLSINLELPAKIPNIFESPTKLWMGRPNYDSLTLQPGPKYMCVGNAMTNVLDSQGNFTLYFLRVGDANFRNFTNDINDAVLNRKNEFVSGAQLPKPHISDVFKTFFGFNKGLTLDLTDTNQGELLNVGRTIQSVDFKEYSIYDLYRRDGYFGFGQLRLHGPIIKGWRYGIYNGIPTRSKAIYRNRHYGQFRDLLEPRKYTKFLNTEGGFTTTDAVVNVNFVSGSSAAISASIYSKTSSTVSFNPFDSGIFDYEYRSGQPFSDTR